MLKNVAGFELKLDLKLKLEPELEASCEVPSAIISRYESGPQNWVVIQAFYGLTG